MGLFLASVALLAIAVLIAVEILRLRAKSQPRIRYRHPRRQPLLEDRLRAAFDLHDVISKEMPLTNPGSLKPAESIALVAFVLSKNGFPAGTTALDASKLKGISLKRP